MTSIGSLETASPSKIWGTPDYEIFSSRLRMPLSGKF